MKRVLLLIKALVVLGVVSSATIAVDGVRSKAESADVIVVLGNEVLDNGEPSSRLQARLDEALAVYEAGAAPVVLVSGGTGESGFDEAAVMARYLLDRGIPLEAILQDPDGVNTRATARNTVGLANEHGWNSVIVVSQYFHISRSKLAMRQEGMETVHGSSPSYFEFRDLHSLPREVVGLASYIIDRWA